MRLLERDDELEILDRAVAAAVAGRGRLVLVEGPAGVGRSALIAAARELATARGLAVRSARGGVLERDFAFGVAGQLLGAAAPGERDLDRLAAGGPLLLAVDDAHWADAPSARALAALAARVAALPVLLVVASRPGEPGAGPDPFAGVRDAAATAVLRPRPLSPAAVAAVVRARLPAAADDLCAAYAETTGGTPLLLGELLLTGADDVAAVRAAAVPAVAERVLRRLARIGPAAPALAEALAVLGDGADLAVAAALAGTGHAEAERVAGELERLELLDGTTFREPLVRRSLYDRLPLAEREAAHAAAAAALRRSAAPLAAIAAQLAAVRPAGSPTVAETLLAAGRDAEERGDREAAARWLARAVAEDAPGPRLRARLSVALGDISARSGRWDDAAGAAARALAACPDDDAELRAEVVGFALAVATWAAAPDVDVEARELDALTARRGPAGQALAGVRAARAVLAGDVQAARPLVDRALAQTPVERPVTDMLVALLGLDELERGLRLADPGRRAWFEVRGGRLTGAGADVTALLDGLPGLDATCRLFVLCEVLLERAEPAEVRALAEGIDADPLAGTRAGALLLSARGRLRLAARERAGGIADLRAALATGLSPALVPLRSWLALALPEAEHAEARALVADELAAARRTGLPRPVGVALSAAGVLAGGAEGVRLLRDAVAELERSPARLDHARALVALGAALRRQQRRAEARAPLAAGLDLARACGALRLAARAQEELRAAGDTPRVLDRADRDTLTASELRVARRAAEGATNQEIAHELLLSLKTVETHLTSVYGKLGLSGRGARRRLPAALADAPG